MWFFLWPSPLWNLTQNTRAHAYGMHCKAHILTSVFQRPDEVFSALGVPSGVVIWASVVNLVCTSRALIFTEFSRTINRAITQFTPRDTRSIKALKSCGIIACNCKKKLIIINNMQSKSDQNKWYPLNSVLPQFISSEPSWQSVHKSHCLCIGTHSPFSHVRSPSSQGIITVAETLIRSVIRVQKWCQYKPNRHPDSAHR